MKKSRKRKRVDEKELDPSILADIFARLHEKKMGTEISEIKIRREEMPYILKYLKLHNIETLTIETSAKLDEVASLLASIDTLRSLTLSAITGNQPIHRGLIDLASHRSLTKLGIRSAKINVEGIAAILKNNVLTQLTLNAINIQDFHNVLSILYHPTLQSLSLIGYKINSNDCNYFLKNTTLKQLSIRNSLIDDKGIQVLSQHPTLTDLTLFEAINPQFSLGIKSLRNIPFLKEFGTRRAPDRRNEIINIAAVHPYLTKLTLRACNIRPNDITPLLKKPLTHLDLSENSGIDNEAADILSTFLSLKSLYLEQCQVGNAGAIALASHPNLIELNLSHNPIYLLGVFALTSNPTITNLRIFFPDRHSIPILCFFFLGNQALLHFKNNFPTNTTLLNQLGPRNFDLQNRYTQEVKRQLEDIYNRCIPSPVIKIVQEYTEGEYPYDYGLFRKAITTQERYIQIKESISQIRTQLKTVKEPEKLDQFIAEIDKQLNYR